MITCEEKEHLHKHYRTDVSTSSYQASKFLLCSICIENSGCDVLNLRQSTRTLRTSFIENTVVGTSSDDGLKFRDVEKNMFLVSLRFTLRNLSSIFDQVRWETSK